MDSTLAYGKKNKWYNKEINEVLFSQPYKKLKIIGSLLDKTSRTTLTKYVLYQASPRDVLSKFEVNEMRRVILFRTLVN